MRPIRLELSGFTAFRDHAVVDFEGCDYFAFTGATGAGKSSLVDAICFALYGSVPRYANEGLVAPVITQGQLEAKVRFDFSVGGVPHTVARVVRRTGTGATTKEARLERGADVLAGDADGVTAQVRKLLGLEFTHFTKCVVLPQGDFARFLHDKAAVRQDLLVKLLGLEVYERMGKAANLRAADAANRGRLWEARLEELSFATLEARAVAAREVDTVAAVVARVEEALPRLEALSHDKAEAEKQACDAEGCAARLEGVVMPAGIGAVAGEAAGAADLLDQAAGAATESEEAVAKAEVELESLPPRAPLEAAQEAHARRRALLADVDQAEAVAVEAKEQEVDSAAALALVQAAAEASARSLEAALRDHRAHELARTLVAGEACPVCRQQVVTLADRPPLAFLDELERAHQSAVTDAGEASARLQTAQQQRAGADARLSTLSAQLGSLDRVLSEYPDAGAVGEHLRVLAEAEERLARARQADGQARAALKAAEATFQSWRRRADEAWRQFDLARDAVASLGPPAPLRHDVADDWSELAGWATSMAPRQREAAEKASRRAAEAGEAAQALRDELLAAAAGAGVDVGHRPVRDACVDARARAEAELRRVEQALEEAERLRRDRATAREQEQVAKALAKHLGARGFEKWVLDGALGLLVEGATDRLRELSDGQYSLSLDKHGNFSVIDHRNADLPRPARTLSGGETFLASLALSLALADRLADLAAGGAARLEAIFLDEGFGALDPASLDIVASAMENLGATDRMVGLITHVRELAERVPVRFEVVKGPHTSAVQRMES